MKTVSIEIPDEVAEVIAQVAAARGVDQAKLVADVLTRFAKLEAQKRLWDKALASPVDDEEAEEDRQLAEWGMEDYAKNLAEEDEA